jgi:hypothetical protein
MLRGYLLAMALLCLSSCSDMCGNSIVRRIASPDARYEAVLFERNCGATTGFATHVSVVSAGDEVTGGGNAFAADDDHGKATSGD